MWSSYSLGGLPSSSGTGGILTQILKITLRMRFMLYSPVTVQSFEPSHLNTVKGIRGGSTEESNLPRTT